MNTAPSKVTYLIEKARPFLLEAGKTLIETTVIVLTDPHPGENAKSKLFRIARQTTIALLSNGLPRTQMQLPQTTSEY